jgi:hypothetical protein
MGYSNYKSLKQTLKKLVIEESGDFLFPQIEEIQPSAWLLQTLEIAEKAPLTNEKSKSERIISPILMEVFLAFQDYVTLYSGEELYVDEQKDLSGMCDFFIAKHPYKSVMQAPIITLAEAKDENMDYGEGQCLAQMYAVQLFNEQEGHAQPFIYGCAVTGGEWKFMKLVGSKVTIDKKTYYISHLKQILGVFHQIIKSFIQ